MATKPTGTEGKTQAEKVKEKALDKEKAKSEKAETAATMEKFLKSFSSSFEKSFNSLTKSVIGVEKVILKSNDKLERIADNSTKIAFNTGATMERLYTLLKHEREADKDNTFKLVDKQFDRIEMMNKNISSINTRTLMVAERLWTLIKHERADDRDDTFVLDEKQFSRIEMMNKNISSINKRADNIQQRIWVLQDLMYKVLEYPKFDVLLDTMVQRHLIDIKDSIEEGTKTKTQAVVTIKPMQYQQITHYLQFLETISNQNEKLLKSIQSLPNKITPVIKQQQSQQQTRNQTPNPKDRQPTVGFWEELWIDITKLSESFSNIFQRGIIGRLAGMNPLLTFAVDILKDIGQTLADVFDTFVKVTDFFRPSKKAAKAGAGSVKGKDPQKKDNEMWIGRIIGSIILGLFSATFKGISNFIDSGISVANKFVVITEKIGGIFSKLFSNFGKLGSVVSSVTKTVWSVSKFFGNGLKMIYEQISKFSQFIGGFLSGRGIIGKFFGILGKFAAPIYATLSGIMGSFEDIKNLTYNADWIDQAMLMVTRGAFEFLGIFVDGLIDLPTWIIGKLFDIDWLAQTDFSSMFVEYAQKGIVSLLNFFNSDILGDFTLNMKRLWSDSISFITDWWNTSEINPANWDWVDTMTEFLSAIPEMIELLVKKIVDYIPDWMVPDDLKNFGMGKDVPEAPQTTPAPQPKQGVKDTIKPVPALPPDKVKENQQKLDDEQNERKTGSTNIINNTAVGGGSQQPVQNASPVFPFNTESSFYGMG